MVNGQSSQSRHHSLVHFSKIPEKRVFSKYKPQEVGGDTHSRLAAHAEYDTEGELLDLIEEFSEGRIQFAFCKVKDPNSGLPKSVLIAWVC